MWNYNFSSIVGSSASGAFNFFLELNFESRGSRKAPQIISLGFQIFFRFFLGGRILGFCLESRCANGAQCTERMSLPFSHTSHASRRRLKAHSCQGCGHESLRLLCTDLNQLDAIFSLHCPRFFSHSPYLLKFFCCTTSTITRSTLELSLAPSQ